MDRDTATHLLAAERARIEQALGMSGDPVEGDRLEVAGDSGDEGLYQDSYDEGRRDDLRGQLAALERAERRLRDGTYGRSTLSGDVISDARLQVMPTAELTAEEQRAAGG